MQDLVEQRSGIRQREHRDSSDLQLLPLADPTRYDDEDYGTGYAFVIPAEAGFEKYYVFDAWIVNERGEKHPGYNESPVPILKTDIALSPLQVWPEEKTSFSY